MIDLTWKMFCETGNIEAYLLLKDLEVQNNTESDNTMYQEQSSRASIHMQ